eukprot:13689600-Alexandrium_andersonii.AAC.1
MEPDSAETLSKRCGSGSGSMKLIVTPEPKTLDQVSSCCVPAWLVRVLKQGSKEVATVKVIEDGFAGLPAEEDFGHAHAIQVTIIHILLAPL